MKKLLPIFIRRSLRVHILTAFGGLLLATVLVVIFYFYHNTTRVVLMLCDDLMEQTTQAVIRRTNDFLAPMVATTEMSSKLATAKVLPFSNLAHLEYYAILTLNTYPEISQFLIGDQAGNYFLSNRQPDGVTATKHINRSQGSPITTWKYWDKNYQLIKTEINTNDTFDPRLRPWYQGATQNRGLYLTDLYIFYTGQKPGITVSYPIFDSKGSVLGVMGSDIELRGLSTFLKSLRIGEHGLAFIINEKKELVAFPDPNRIIDWQAEDGVLRPVYVEDLEIPSITAAFKKHRNSGADRIAVEVGGQKYLATFREFPPSFGKRWKVGIVVPADDFIGAVKKINQGVIFVCLVILGVAALVVVLLSRSISKPILRIAEETDRIGKFKIEGQLQFRSNIYEIQTLQEAVKRMKASLLSFTRFAPQQLVQEIVVQGKEAMLGGERREVTMLFADLRNFTRFSDHTAPEGVVHLLNDHFEAMVTIIARHGGYVVDFMGDSLFVVFGAPEMDLEHAAKAVKCAVSMQMTRQQLNDQLIQQGLPALEMGIGINSGSCVVGNMGSQTRIKYGVVGQAVNLAARIESFTVGSQVLVSDMTHRLVQEDVIAAGPLEVSGKGLRAPIRLWEVRGLQNEPDALLPPTVPELAALSRPIPIRLRFLRGKQVEAEVHQGKLISLSPAGAEIITDWKLGAFSSLQLQLPCFPENEFVDGKVVGLGKLKTAYLVRFSGLEPSTSASISLFIQENIKDGHQREI